MENRYQLWESLRARVIQRAASDAAFKNLLMTNPSQAVESELGVKVPSNVKFHVHEDSSSSFHLVIPATGGELSDQDLEAAAGGTTDPVINMY